MNRKTRKSNKPYNDLALPDMVDHKVLTQEDGTKIKQIVSSRIKQLDELLEEQLVSILFGDKELNLPREKQENIILFAKQIYFQG